MDMFLFGAFCVLVAVAIFVGLKDRIAAKRQSAGLSREWIPDRGATVRVPVAARERLYDDLLRAAFDRQDGHEKEHIERHRHGGAFTPLLRAEAVARRYIRKCREAGLPLPTLEQARERVKEAACRQGG
jgi:predicted RNase H-like nuclease